MDPSIGTISGQASLPGLTMEPASTYAGSLASSDQCTSSADVGRIVCVPVIRNGLTITRSIAFYNAAGQPQPRRGGSACGIGRRETPPFGRVALAARWLGYPNGRRGTPAD